MDKKVLKFVADAVAANRKNMTFTIKEDVTPEEELEQEKQQEIAEAVLGY